MLSSLHRGLMSLLSATAVCLALTACDLYPVLAANDPQAQGAAPPAADVPQENALLIENDSQLPDTFPGASYELKFNARGGVPTLHWRLEKGELPPGLKLEDNGLLRGSPERGGEFQFTLSVIDGSKPQQAVQKQFFLRVRSALTVVWKTPAHVNANRIEGSVEVSNSTPDDMDLTFICMAVAGNGRATAIGYQRFNLVKGATKELPLGETLPNGGYVVHVDAVGEVAKRNLIYHERLQTPGPLQVLIGP